MKATKNGVRPHEQRAQDTVKAAPGTSLVATPAMPVAAGVYAVRNLVDGAVYVGSARDVDVRWAQHQTALDRSCHPNAAFQAAWLQLGAGAFDLSVLEYVSSREDLALAEQRWIDQYCAAGVHRVYNAQSRAIRRQRTPLSLDQAAHRLHLTTQQLTRWVKEGRVLSHDRVPQSSSPTHSKQIGFDRDEIDEAALQMPQSAQGRIAERASRLRSNWAQFCRRLRYAR